MDMPQASRPSRNRRPKLTPPPLSPAVYASHHQRVASFDAGARGLVEYAERAGRIVNRSIVADIQRGVLPSPQTDPAPIEEALYARATLLAQRSPFLVDRHPFDGLMTLALVLQCSDHVGWTAYNVSHTLAADLRTKGVGSPSKATADSKAQRQDDLLMLHEAPDWYSAGLVALRDVILVVLAKEPRAATQLGVQTNFLSATYRVPVFVSSDGTART